MNFTKSISFLAASLLILVSTGCEKYPEGPIFSLQTKTERISNVWEVVKATDADGNDVTDALDLEFDFDKNGEATMIQNTSIGSFEFVGDWALKSDNDIFDLDLTDKLTGIIPYERDYDILRLTKDEFWIYDISNEVEIQLGAK